MDMKDGIPKPDRVLLSQMFPERLDEPLVTEVLRRTTRNNCLFLAKFATSSALVRIEPYNRKISTASAIMQAARTVCPEYVPLPVRSDIGFDSSEKMVDFLVTEHAPGVESLKDLWFELPDDQQCRIMDQLFQALQKLHRISFQNKDVRSALNKTRFTRFMPRDRRQRRNWRPIGDNKQVDICRSLQDFLEKISACYGVTTLRPYPGGPNFEPITMLPEDKSVMRVTFTVSETRYWRSHIVLCHNDLEPRNILVRKQQTAEGNTVWNLDAIVDWGSAGFAPFEYEYYMKDYHMTLAGRNPSWYLAFRERMKALLRPNSKSFGDFMDAVIGESIRRNRRNWGSSKVLAERCFARWLEREQLEYRGTLVGWALRDGATLRPYNDLDDGILLEEAIRAIEEEENQGQGQPASGPLVTS